MVEVDSWAAQVEAEGEGHGVERTEVMRDGVKHVTEVRNNEKGQRVKIFAQYKVEKKRVPRAIATRRKWKKFGDAKDDGDTPNAANTHLSNEITIQFIRNSAGELLDVKSVEDTPVAKQSYKCASCQGFDHFTFQCPYKHLMDDAQSALNSDEPMDASMSAAQKEVQSKEKAGLYVPAHLKAGAAGRAAPGPNDRRDDFTVRITNLPEETTEDDLKEILSAVSNPADGRGGRSAIYRHFLARDKATNRCKGFAFVTFTNKADAERAILILAGHRYEHLILKVEWARPSNT